MNLTFLVSNFLRSNSNCSRVPDDSTDVPQSDSMGVSKACHWLMAEESDGTTQLEEQT